MQTQLDYSVRPSIFTDLRTQQEIGRERTGSKPGSRVASPDVPRQQAVYFYAVFYDGRRTLRFTGLSATLVSGRTGTALRLTVASLHCSLWPLVLVAFVSFVIPLQYVSYTGDLIDVPSRWQLNGFIAFSCFCPTVASSGLVLASLSLGDVRGWANWS